VKRPLILLLAALWLALFPAAVLAPAPGAEEASGPPTTEQLAARERIRPKIEAIFADMKAEWDPNEDHSHYFPEATEAIVALGPEVVPFLVAEIELMDTQTYHYCAYALGRLGGPDAEAALRKAYRRSVDRGGPFGHAAERLALYGLAVMGKPDVVDLMQEGLPVQGLEMLPDLPLATQYAMLTAPGNVPNLLKQLETYKSDPEAVDKLRWTITALGRSGESSVAPKLLPFLDHASAPIRAAAAEALSRVGPPSVCNDLLAHLGDSHVKTNYVIVEALERMKPAQCLKGMISRLEVEPNLEVRAGLYRTLMAIQGETALESLRTGYARGGVIERALVIRYAGDLGSKKGLTLVRAALTDKSPEVVDAAVDALGDIGGPAAIDTLLALVTNPHRDIALNATKALVNLDEKRAGPRVASRLLEIVAEPVGDLTLRPPIVQYSEALVSLAFVDARDDIRKAADLQSDGEIREQLRSCARRLDRIATAGDDLARRPRAGPRRPPAREDRQPRRDRRARSPVRTRRDDRSGPGRHPAGDRRRTRRGCRRARRATARRSRLRHLGAPIRAARDGLGGPPDRRRANDPRAHGVGHAARRPGLGHPRGLGACRPDRIGRPAQAPPDRAASLPGIPVRPGGGPDRRDPLRPRARRGPARLRHPAGPALRDVSFRPPRARVRVPASSGPVP